MSARAWSDHEVRTALGIAGRGGAAEGELPDYPRISTDTRTIEKGDLFVALVGERFDAHDFLGQAVEAGARGAVVSRKVTGLPEDFVLYPVEDTLEALGQLAAYRRTSLSALFIAVVGSNGKTTTKELIRSAVSERFNTHATEGNLNNRIGVPLTIFSIPPEAEVAVIEMGTNRPGEIAALTRIVRPDHVVVTSIGEEHLELLGDLEGVMEEELSVLEGLDPEGKAFVADEPMSLVRAVRERIGRGRVRVAGLSRSAELRPDRGDRGIHTLEDGSTLWRYRGLEVRLPIPGRINVRNALLALGVAAELGIHSQAAVRGIGRVRVPELRAQWVEFGDLRVLADCYNANPPSVAAAIDLLTSLPTRGRKIAVLGTMRELGEASEKLHAASAETIAREIGEGIDIIVATGEFGPAFKPFRNRLADRLVIADDAVAGFNAVADTLRPDDTILLKASRGDRLERWLELLEERFG